MPLRKEQFLVVLSGALKGARYPIKSGMTIGRARSSITITDDSKVSANHARVDIDNKGNWVLKDLGSTNGTFLGDRRVRGISLVYGVKFRLGNTEFSVQQEEPRDIFSPKPSEVLAEAPTPKIKEDGWLIKLKGLVLPSISGTSSKPNEAQALPWMLALHFIQGPQLGDKIYLGFGPRTAGFNHLDVPLRDPKAPDLCFRVKALDDKIIIEDLSEGRALLNKKPFDAEPLTHGDELQFAQTKIRFLNA